MPTGRIEGQEQLAAVADPRRLGILRLLMLRPATLTQIGQRIGKHPAWVRHHMQVLVHAGLVELVEERVVGNYTEKYYAATASSFETHLLVVPESDMPETLVMLGSHDLGLELLAQDIQSEGVGLVNVPVGSLDGLVALRQGLCDVAGCHLFDEDLGEYNIPFLRHLFPDIPVIAVTLARREQGLIVAAGNPLGLKSLEDVATAHARFVNRNRGSGTRVWIDRTLKVASIQSEDISGYDRAVDTHTQAAIEVAADRADAAVGISAAAEPLGLGFVPLFDERYDLVMTLEAYSTQKVVHLLDRLHATGFRHMVARMRGYDPSEIGEEYRLAG